MWNQNNSLDWSIDPKFNVTVKLMGKDADAFYEFMTAPTTKVSVVSRKKNISLERK